MLNEKITKEDLMNLIPSIDADIDGLFGSTGVSVKDTLDSRNPIRFSNIIKYSCSGRSHEEIRREIEKLAKAVIENNFPAGCINPLNDINDEDGLTEWGDHYERNLEELSRCYDYDPNEQDRERIEEIKRLHRETEFTTILLARYDRKTRQIILYHEAIEEFCRVNNLGSCRKVLEAVFARECFVAHLLDEAKRNSVRSNSKVLALSKDALAAYFEYRYCEKNHYFTLTDLYKKQWKEHCSKYWPYSLALPIIEHNESIRIARIAYNRIVVGLDASELILGCKAFWELL